MIRIEAVPVLTKELMAGLKAARGRRTSRSSRRKERVPMATSEDTAKTMPGRSLKPALVLA